MAKNPTTKRSLSPRSAKKTAPKPASRALTAPKKARKGPTNAEVVFQMLNRPEGVSLEELMKKLNVLQHTARAYVSVVARDRTGRKAVLADGRYRLG